MSVLQRKELEGSPLADLHAIASELGLEGYRSLRKADLIAAILGEGSAEAAQPEREEPAQEERAREEPPSQDTARQEPPREDTARQEPPREDTAAESRAGVLDVLPNGSGFLRVELFEHSRDDVYVSPAQIRRCELRAGDEVAGPVRSPHRSERHPSLVRVETVNGSPAEPPEKRPSFAELTPVFARERLAGPAELESVPLGKGSRVAIAGPPGAGATTLLRRVAEALAERESEVELMVVLVGVRPEEVTDWRREAQASVAGGGFDRSSEAQTQIAELAVERAKRAVERGRDVVLLLDSLEALPSGPARRLFGAARNTEEGGSLTVIAATGMAWDPQRHATTRIQLEPWKEAERQPVVSQSRSSTLRADLLGP